MRFTKRAFGMGWITALFILLAPIAWAAESVVLQDGSQRFQLKTQTGGKIIHLYRLGSSKEPLPDELSLSIFQGDGRVKQVTLKALSPPKSGQSIEPAYAAKLDQGLQPFVGLELKFFLGKKNPQEKILRWSAK